MKYLIENKTKDIRGLRNLSDNLETWSAEVISNMDGPVDLKFIFDELCHIAFFIWSSDILNLFANIWIIFGRIYFKNNPDSVSP